MIFNKGFTLVELLIVITIISVLTSIGVVSYRSLVQSGRDAKRQTDLRTIQSALEQYYADQFYYPTSVGVGGSLTFGSKTYLNNVPQDPQAPSRYYCFSKIPPNCDNIAGMNRCTSYALYADLENTGNAQACTAGAFTCDGVSFDCMVTPP